MYHVYAISSFDRNYIYVGLSKDLVRRLKEHNSGCNKTTKPYSPFILIYKKVYTTRQLAREQEKYLKSSSGKRFLRKLLKLG